MGQIDHVHDAENQRQASRQQKQHQTKLQSIEGLLKIKIVFIERGETCWCSA